MLTLLRWISRRPLWLLHAVGAAAGWISYGVSPTYRRRFDANVAQAGIERRDARPAIAAAGHLIAELPFLWLRPPSTPVLDRVRWVGAELIEAAHAQGRGIVFLTPHIGCFEVTAQAYAERFAPRHGPITVLYRPARKVWLRALVDTARRRPGLGVAPATLAGVRQMIRALRRGEAVGLLPDQVPPDGQGVWAPFFGRPAYTMTLASRLAQQTGAAMLLAWGERLPHGRGYIVHIAPFAAGAGTGAPEASRAFHAVVMTGDTGGSSATGQTAETMRTRETRDAGVSGDTAQAESAAAVNRAMEALVRRCPQQYLWGYDRYKTPRGAPEAADAVRVPRGTERGNAAIPADRKD